MKVDTSIGALVGEFLVAFLLVFIASRTAVNSVFFIRCLKRTWDQTLSSGLLLMFMSTHIFQFRFLAPRIILTGSWIILLGYSRALWFRTLKSFSLRARALVHRFIC